MVPSLTPCDFPFPKNGGSICPQHTRMAISPQRVIRSTSCLVLWWGFRGRRIERRYLRFEQIQDGGCRHVEKISNGHISATGRPIHLMFCSRVGFSGTADLMALFSIRKNSRGRPPPAAAILDNFEWPYLRNGYLYSAHRAVTFAIAQISCLLCFLLRFSIVLLLLLSLLISHCDCYSAIRLVSRICAWNTRKPS